MAAMRINLRRGFNRMFIVFATCWYLAMILFLWNDWKALIFGDVFDTIDPTGKPVILFTLAAGLLPPAAYAFGWAIAWIVKGFRRAPSDRPSRS